MSVVDDRPIVTVPCYLVEEHETALTTVVHIVAVIEEPGLSFVVGYDFAVVTWAFPTAVTRDDGGIVVAHHLSALLVDVRACKLRGTSHNCPIRTVLTITT